MTGLAEIRARAEKYLAEDARGPFVGTAGAIFARDVLALCDVADAAEELKLWEPGRRGWAAAYNRFTEALARVVACPAEKGDAA